MPPINSAQLEHNPLCFHGNGVTIFSIDTSTYPSEYIIISLGTTYKALVSGNACYPALSRPLSVCETTNGYMAHELGSSLSHCMSLQVCYHPNGRSSLGEGCVPMLVK